MDEDLSKISDSGSEDVDKSPFIPPPPDPISATEAFKESETVHLDQLDEDDSIPF